MSVTPLSAAARHAPSRRRLTTGSIALRSIYPFTQVLCWNSARFKNSGAGAACAACAAEAADQGLSRLGDGCVRPAAECLSAGAALGARALGRLPAERARQPRLRGPAVRRGRRGRKCVWLSPVFAYSLVSLQETRWDHIASAPGARAAPLVCSSLSLRQQEPGRRKVSSKPTASLRLSRAALRGLRRLPWA